MSETLATEKAIAADAESETGVQTEQESEQKLVLLCQQGDRQSFRLLYQRYQHRVRSTIYQLCGKSMLDDLVQEVFLRAWKGLPKLRTTKYFATWLYRISWNVATDQRRKLARGREQTNFNEKSEDKDQLSYSKNLSNIEDTPDLMHLHYQDLVQRGLNNLSFDHRAVLVLHDLEDLPQKQVAEILDVPVGTVKSRLFHARNSFKKFLEQKGLTF
ncbi:sigma-70 family RNA polymerase sigma factor [Pleurocapsa sp. PCC 7319]|uniref:sigma-70 family RNA polymerase sigma factor n=1 Tax=Pleurocapsa sp. PCC 7319 TaxID=118161 RepID=UPI00034B76C3|nr:sigma-70 family RNA polymerase sigma factor [Pleurocapsa sp. PCC 7319]